MNGMGFSRHRGRIGHPRQWPRVRFPVGEPDRAIGRSGRIRHDRWMRIDKETFDRLDSTRPRLMPWLALLFVGSAALGVYFLVSPASGAGAYYRSVLNRMT